MSFSCLDMWIHYVLLLNFITCVRLEQVDISQAVQGCTVQLVFISKYTDENLSSFHETAAAVLSTNNPTEDYMIEQWEQLKTIKRLACFVAIINRDEGKPTSDPKNALKSGLSVVYPSTLIEEVARDSDHALRVAFTGKSPGTALIIMSTRETKKWDYRLGYTVEFANVLVYDSREHLWYIVTNRNGRLFQHTQKTLYTFGNVEVNKSPILTIENQYHWEWTISESVTDKHWLRAVMKPIILASYYRNITPHKPVDDAAIELIVIGNLHHHKRMTPSTIRIAIDQKQYSFLTCWEKEKISYVPYTEPFNTSVWIALLLTLSALVLLGIMVLILKGNVDFQTFFALPFVFLEGLLDDCTNVPAVIRDVLKFRVAFMLWLLSCHIFVNSYLTISISNVAAPLPTERIERFEHLATAPEEYCNATNHDCIQKGVKKAEKIKEMREWLAFMKLDKNKILLGLGKIVGLDVVDGLSLACPKPYTLLMRQYPKLTEHCGLLNQNDFTLIVTNLDDPLNCQYANPLWGSKFGDFMNEFLDFYKTIWEEENVGKYKKEHVKQAMLAVNLFCPLHIASPLDPSKVELNEEFDAELLLTQCDKKLVYASDRETVSRELRYLTSSYPRKRFYESTDQLNVPLTAFEMNIEDPRMRRIIRGVFESNIIKRFKNPERSFATQRRRNITKSVQRAIPQDVLLARGLNMYGSIHTVFVIWAILLALAVTILLTENGKVFYRKMLKAPGALLKFVLPFVSILDKSHRRKFYQNVKDMYEHSFLCAIQRFFF